ncbi:uncharacterized protein [Drosophila kikkawai]|uniref:Uncharacterized protein n=1 Tax=Drosophila kikkawai TaxID=30033 RepID=A0A6P4IBA4_DROKI|nr:uncharacterized protein LOC108073788 [Drosophila kikkawai]
MEENVFQNTKDSLLRKALLPLNQSDLDDLPSTSKGVTSASVLASLTGIKSFEEAEDSLQWFDWEEPEFSGWSNPTKRSASKRTMSIKTDPAYSPKAKLDTAHPRMMTRSLLKRDRAMLLSETATGSGAKEDQKPKPKVVTSLRRFKTSQRITPTVWHSGNVCHHALRQICDPETRQSAENDVERWRAIEAICLDLRGINVRGDVGVLKGPVSFEDVFQVLGLDEQGEPVVEPSPSPEIKVVSSEDEIEVVSPSVSRNIDNALLPPLTPIQGGIYPARELRERVLKLETKSVAKSSRRSQKRTTKSTRNRR